MSGKRVDRDTRDLLKIFLTAIAIYGGACLAVFLLAAYMRT